MFLLATLLIIHSKEYTAYNTGHTKMIQLLGASQGSEVLPFSSHNPVSLIAGSETVLLVLIY